MITLFQSDVRTRAESLARLLLVLSIPVSLAVLSMGLPSAMFEDLITWALLFVGAGAIALSILYRPQRGLLLLAIGGLILPPALERRLPEGLSLSALLAPLVILAWVLIAAGRSDENRWSWSMASRPVSLLMTGAVVSLVFGQYPWFPVPGAPMRAQLGALGMFVFSGGVFMAAQDLLRDTRVLCVLTWSFLLTAAVRIGLLLLPQSPDFLVDLIPSGTLGSVFWVWLVSIAFSQMLLNGDLATGWRLGLLALLLAVGYITFFEWRTWASGWLPAMAGAATILGFWKPKLTAGMALLLVPVAVWQLDSLWNAVWIGDQAYSYLTRVEAVRTLSNLGWASPIFGLGPANYYHYTPLFPLLGWYVQFSSHNNYVDLFLQAGAVGLIAFLWFATSLGRTILRVRDQMSSGFSRAYVYGAAGGLAGTLCAAALGDWVIPFAYNVGIRGFAVSILAWIFLGGVAALAHEAKK